MLDVRVIGSIQLFYKVKHKFSILQNNMVVSNTKRAGPVIKR